MELSPPEVRVLGSLLEKQLATPQYYPLTLNALRAACNQSSNREPVTALTDAEVLAAIEDLRGRGLVRVVHSSPGSRTIKYRHVLDERFGLDDGHLAVLAVLFLRGPQTVGELRTRTERLAGFSSLAEVEEIVRLLGDRDEPLATVLARAPGQKEARVTHLLGAAAPPGAAPPAAAPGAAAPAAGPPAAGTNAPAPAAAGTPIAAAGATGPPAMGIPPAPDGGTPPLSGEAALAARVADLEAEVASLRQALEELRHLLG